MHYHIDKTAAQSAYLQLYHQLRRDIVSGVYPLGTKMPSKRLIATETGVSVITAEHRMRWRSYATRGIWNPASAAAFS